MYICMLKSSCLPFLPRSARRIPLNCVDDLYIHTCTCREIRTFEMVILCNRLTPYFLLAVDSELSTHRTTSNSPTNKVIEIMHMHSLYSVYTYQVEGQIQESSSQQVALLWWMGVSVGMVQVYSNFLNCPNHFHLQMVFALTVLC